ncbi:MAG: alanine--tRNA ligase-related protein [Alphaproteobacteria bacterium]|nr:alanine--tRNA ligase-related protein [Alphaproteobacteria bacterium]
MTTTTQIIREQFLEFFQSRDHMIIPGASLVPSNDPTLLLINSGMAPIKPYFTAEAVPISPRLCNVQKCIRTNDIEDVGDRSHLTFFEMLGSWSIGDYFKDVAVELAGDLLMGKLNIPQSKLYATVYKGNDTIGLAYDEESHRAWERLGFKSNQIVPLGDEDNLWGPAGDTGPCGPCTEVFIDLGDKTGIGSYEETGIFNTRRYIEIWNAGVFMQLNKNADGSYAPLPFTSVDTGAGLERLTMAINGNENVYQEEPYTLLLTQMPSVFSQHECRVVADHVRAASHLISDGVSPGRNGREYITRRLIRRMETIAACHRTKIPYPELLNVVQAKDGRNHEEFKKSDALIREVVAAEVAVFSRTLSSGLKAFDKVTRKLNGSAELPSQHAFNIVTAHGFPLEALEQIATTRGLRIDRPGVELLMDRHKALSRGAPKPK